MKLIIFVNFLFFVVIFYVVVIFEGIVYGNNKKILRSFLILNMSGWKDDNLKINDVIFLRRIFGKLCVVGRVLR